MNPNNEKRKVAIIGCGKVGMTTAYGLVIQGLTDELVLYGRHKDRLMGEKYDLDHGLAFLKKTKIVATDSYADLVDTDLTIITAGAAQKPGDTRLDLVDKNVAIMESIIPQVLKYAPNTLIMLVSNPVDVLTYKAYKLAGLPKGRIFGSGTNLDTARFRFYLSEFIHVNPKSIHAYILGEHGDSSFPVIKSANVGGQSLDKFENFSIEKANRAYDEARNAAYKIIKAKGSTYYGIASSIARITKAIFNNEKSILPLSIPLHRYRGHNGVALSLPCVIGRNGVEDILNIDLSWDERQKLAHSVNVLKKYC